MDSPRGPDWFVEPDEVMLWQMKHPARADNWAECYIAERHGVVSVRVLSHVRNRPLGTKFNTLDEAMAYAQDQKQRLSERGYQEREL
jgi:hypothetical protein